MNPFVEYIDIELAEIFEMLSSKNDAYGNSALDPVRIFSGCDCAEQLRVRADDKLSRIRAARENSTIDTEDAELDLIGYLILMRIERRMRLSHFESSTNT